MTQSDPAVGAKRLRNCVWQPSAEVRIGSDWLSGVYVIPVEPTDEDESVRDERSRQERSPAAQTRSWLW